MKLTASQFIVTDWDLGNALMEEVLSEHPQSPKGVWKSARPHGYRLEWNDEFERAYPNAVAFAKTANILMDRAT